MMCLIPRQVLCVLNVHALIVKVELSTCPVYTLTLPR